MHDRQLPDLGKSPREELFLQTVGLYLLLCQDEEEVQLFAQYLPERGTRGTRHQRRQRWNLLLQQQCRVGLNKSGPLDGKHF